MFKQLEGDSVVLKSNGVVTVHDLYEWRGELYAAVGKGYVRLNVNGTTSKDRLYMEHLVTEAHLFSDKFGRLATVDKGGYTALAANPEGQLVQLPAPEAAE